MSPICSSRHFPPIRLTQIIELFPVPRFFWIPLENGRLIVLPPFSWIVQYSLAWRKSQGRSEPMSSPGQLALGTFPHGSTLEMPSTWYRSNRWLSVRATHNFGQASRGLLIMGTSLTHLIHIHNGVDNKNPREMFEPVFPHAHARTRLLS
jgi:hypothetical protein